MAQPLGERKISAFAGPKAIFDLPEISCIVFRFRFSSKTKYAHFAAGGVACLNPVSP